MRYSVLISTRNRPKELDVLLRSISKQAVTPNQVVVISSGESILPILSDHSSLPILHCHSEISGQILQKRMGLGLIDTKSDWVLFLDDDLELESHTTSILSNFVSELDSNVNVLGIGLSCVDEFLEKNSLRKVSSYRFGKVSAGGVNYDYMNSDKSIFTEWLNGASLWRKDVLFHYDLPIVPIKYAFGEDLIFSYKVSRLGSLFFLKQAKFRFQKAPTYNVRNFEMWQASAYWRYYFVASNGLSASRFLLNLVISASIFLLRNYKCFHRYFVLISVDLYRISIAFVRKLNPEVLLSQTRF